MSIRSFFRFLYSFAAFLFATNATAAVTYIYDAHHRLLSATYDYGTTILYTYDIAGNRISTTSLTDTSKLYEDAQPFPEPHSNGTRSGFVVCKSPQIHDGHAATEAIG
ncbi:RHS repeat protein [Desulfobulbus rhabdoformis]|jgi:YD repeat-containing protein|uniref:RHS repeat domain-containing protein n=1 Tax=Desulfobulbus rhabdoformis TaxID=34032 RepID=UPI001963B252|nr:RHS repeat domain-containing protein [Desulfobulbus rhabdoformis]MBM9616513.1 RHS repeat protein [Desulfobulbus rhabdoformis]